MKDDYEKYYSKLKDVYLKLHKAYDHNLTFEEYEETIKIQIKEILEEIWQDGYEKAIEDFNDLANGKLKEAKDDEVL